MAAEEILNRLAAFNAYHGELWQGLVAAGAEAYLDRAQEVAEGAAAEAARRLTEEVEAAWPGLAEHLRQEEEILVPCLLPVLGDRVGPLASMLAEHRQIRAAVADLSAGGRDRPAGVGELLLLLDDHLRKEQYILFPLAREVIIRGQGVGFRRQDDGVRR